MPVERFSSPSDLFLDRYRAGDLGAFYGLGPDDLAGAVAAVRPVPRAALVSALRAHAGRLGAPAATSSALDRLSHPEARAVVTGQQVGLLLGPTYSLAKAVTAIRLAAELDREDRPVVPIFWLASQDHDHGEIDHAFVLDLDEQLRRVALALPADAPAGRIAMRPAYLDELEAGLAQVRCPAPFREDALALLREGAALASTVADWFGAMLYRLMGERGLILIDPLEPAVAELFVPLVRRELEEPQASVEAVRSAGEALRSEGFEPQLGRGSQATNLFVEEPLEGRREPVRRLLRFDGKGFFSETRTYRRAELLARLDDDPGAITPAAGLRPTSQDGVLPTAATVVGPGELRYFAQLRGVYAHHGVTMPLIWPRATVTVIEPPVRRILAKYELAVGDYLADPEAALADVLLARHGHGERFAATLADLDARVARLLDEVDAVDPTLCGAVLRGREHLATTVAILRRKTVEALAREDATTRSQFARLRAHLLPLDAPQERVLSPFSFFLKFGIDPLLGLLDEVGSTGDYRLDL